MKQKYRIWQNVKEKELHIQEYAVLTADSKKQKYPRLQDEDFSLLCEQTYKADQVQKATARGKDELILLLRNQHFFPIGRYMDLIADTVTSINASKDEQHQDLIFDDKGILQSDLQEAATSVISDIKGASTGDEPASDIDELLEDDSHVTADDTTPKIKPDKVDEAGEY
jgi:hypothetical protein